MDPTTVRKPESKMVRLLKDWTLPVAMTLGCVVYFIFSLTPFLEGAADFFAPIFERIVPLFMFLILFVTFCKVDFHKMRPVRWHLWIGIFQVLFVVILMVFIVYLRLSGNNLILSEAILTCIIAPCAAAAPVVTQKLGGNLEQMTTYTFLSNFITALLIPICFPMIDKAADITFLSAFLKILREVCLVLVLPMLLAYVVKHRMKRFHRLVIGVKDLSYYMWACSLSILTGVTLRQMVHANNSVWFILSIAFLGFILCVVQYSVGRFVGHYFDMTLEAGQGLGQKNTAFAIWISYTYLHPLSAVGPGCYILWQNMINSVEI